MITNLILDVTKSYLFLSFKVVYLEQSNRWIFRIRNYHLLKFKFLPNIWCHFIYSNVAIWKLLRKKYLNENFKAIADWDRPESKLKFMKNMQNWENLIYPIFFDPISNRYYIKQNPVTPSEFVITRVHCTKYFFQIAHQLLPLCMDAPWQNSE